MPAVPRRGMSVKAAASDDHRHIGIQVLGADSPCVHSAYEMSSRGWKKVEESV